MNEETEADFHDGVYCPCFGAGLPVLSLIARAAARPPQAPGYQRPRSSRLPAAARRTGLLRPRVAPQHRPPPRDLFSSSEPSGPGVPSAQGWPHCRASLAAPALRIPPPSPSGQETKASSGASGSRGRCPRGMPGCGLGRGTSVGPCARVCASWLPVRRPRGAGGRGAVLHPRPAVPEAAPPPLLPGDPRRRRLDRVPVPEDTAPIPESLQAGVDSASAPGRPHAEARPRRGGGRSEDPFRRGRPGGARLCFCCPLVPAPRAPPANAQAQRFRAPKRP